MPGKVMAQDFDMPSGGFDQPQQHGDCGGLARTIAAQEGRGRASGHLETDVVHGCFRTEGLGQTADFNGLKVGGVRGVHEGVPPGARFLGADPTI